MSWESVIPSIFAGDAPEAAESPMDSDAFAGFYERSSRSLWAYLARVSGDPALADDLMQESYLRYLCASRPGLHLAEGEVAGRRYLFRIATTCCAIIGGVPAPHPSRSFLTNSWRQAPIWLRPTLWLC